jgi:hypothetical protein
MSYDDLMVIYFTGVFIMLVICTLISDMAELSTSDYILAGMLSMTSWLGLTLVIFSLCFGGTHESEE